MFSSQWFWNLKCVYKYVSIDLEVSPIWFLSQTLQGIIYMPILDLIWLLVLFLIALEEFLTVWIQKLSRFFSMKCTVELLGQIIYLSDRLLLEKLFLGLIVSLFCQWILKAFILASCIDFGYWICA